MGKINKSNEYVNPSLGQIGIIYYDERNNRIKYFSTEIHLEPEGIEKLVEKGIHMMYKNNATRLNARFFYKGNEPYSKGVEARIPLNNGYSGTDLLFMGINEPERVDPEETIVLEDKIISDILSGKLSSRNIVDNKYQIERLSINCLREGDIKSLVGLYAEAFHTYTTDLNEDSILEMIENSVVYGIRDKKTMNIVSTSVAEIGSVPTILGEFKICELSEMATKREYRGKGLVTFATKALIAEIRDSVDLVYAEARASLRAINQSFFNLGFSYAGRLNKQCILSGDYDIQETGPYENLNVWYMLPHEEI